VWELYEDVPAEFITHTPPHVDGPLSEMEVRDRIDGMLSKNRTSKQLRLFVGGGVWPHYVPAAVTEVTTRSEFLTSYTPYQPEVSQGMLQALFEYQSMVAELYGVDVVNSSMYDWATALGEACRMASRYNDRRRIVVAWSVPPERLEVARTYSRPLGVELVQVALDGRGRINEEELKTVVDGDTAAVYVENPSYLGFIVENVEAASEIAHDKGALFMVGAEPTSLGLLTPPGEYGADIIVGEGQPLGLPMNFGGPLLGILGCRLEQKLVHSLPGRLIGLTEDLKERRRAFTMILRAREQDIKREKATSNICTNQALCAVAAAAYLALLGRRGLEQLAEHIFAKTAYMIDRFRRIGSVEAPLFDAPHYMEFTYRVRGKDASRVLEDLFSRDIVGGIDISASFPELGSSVLTCVTEVHGRSDIEMYVRALSEVL